MANCELRVTSNEHDQPEPLTPLLCRGGYEGPEPLGSLIKGSEMRVIVGCFQVNLKVGLGRRGGHERSSISHTAK